VTSNFSTRMGLRRAPYAFTEHGVTMLAAILKSSRAIQMSIRIVRAFVQLREMLAVHRDLAIRMDRLEQEQQSHASVINILAEEIDALKLPPVDPPKRAIGFQALTGQECN
jgi:phage regulator Rha-like protein